MLEYTIIEPDGILRLQPSGALTVGDFEGLTRFTDAYLSTHAHLAGMLVEAREFPGWDSFAALASHVRFIRRHERRIARVALVTDSSIAHVVGTLAEPFAAADIRSFDSHEAGDALEWLRSYRRMAFNVLIVLTSHDRLGDTGRPTGFWLEELAAPYYVFLDAGVGMTLASPKGGRPPLDPASDRPDSATDATPPFQVRSHRYGGTRQYPTAPRHPGDGFRRRLLSRGPWAPVGSGRGPRLHRAHRDDREGWKATWRRLPCAGYPSSSGRGGPADRERQAGNRFLEHGGTGGGPQ